MAKPPKFGGLGVAGGKGGKKLPVCGRALPLGGKPTCKGDNV